MQNLFKINRYWCFTADFFLTKHIPKTILPGVEKLPFDSHLLREDPIDSWLTIDDIAQDRESFARDMDSDLMHFSGFYFYFDQGNSSQDRMLECFFISALTYGLFAIPFIDYRLSSTEFFIKLFF